MHYNNSEKNMSLLKEEYNILKNGSAIRINSNAAVIQLEGKDTLEFMHRVSTNAVKDLKPFEKKNTLFLNAKGRFIDRTTLINLENFYLLIGNLDGNKKLFNWINKYIIMEDIKTADVTNDYKLIELIGPQSESYLTLLVGDDIKKLGSENVISTNADGFSFYLFRNSLINGKISFQILIEKERSDEFIEYMLNNKSVFDVGMISDETYGVARIESGNAALPNELNDKYNPHEVNLIHEVCFKKGCYIGQEVIARLDTYDKVQKKMIGIIINDNINLNGNSVLIDEEENEVGEITSHAFSELIGKKIALGFITKKTLQENKTIYVFENGQRMPITICELPFKK